ncbi:LTA synthase family protein [Methylococcaceae bacterium WWC4]|nr:LTA synthase family protein [Methylococcaceae bacterium WWC4]
MLKLLGWLLLAAPLALKGLYVDRFIYDYTGTRWLGLGQVIANDAVLFFAILLLGYVSLSPRLPRPAVALLRLTALAIWAVYWIDYAIIVNFNTHLALGDAIKYTDYSLKYIRQIYGLSDAGLALLGAALAILPAYWVLARFPAVATRRKWPLALICSLPLATAFAENERYAHAWIYKNVIDYNLTILSEASPYSPAFRHALRYRETLSCQTAAPAAPNVIVLMVESLSAYQSRFFSGIEDWTPNLDAIAAEQRAYTQFYANGFITEDGEIALLTGILPLYPPSSYSDDGGTSFHSFYDLPEALPRVLKPLGYRSEFLTTADLEFGNTGDWARRAGFDGVEGHDHPEYDRWERFHFQAAPDEALYRRLMDRVAMQRGPYLLFAKTVSSHHPYINPETKEKSESAAIRYTDQQLGRFYRQLRASGFFDNGVLVIVGDHHSMTPLKKAEGERFGPFKASARVPLVLAGRGIPPGVEARPFQQIDVYHSLRGLIEGRQCHGDWIGDLLAGAPPRFILHRRGDNRDMVSLFSEDADYLIKLDGDATRLAGKAPADPNLAREWLDKVNAARIARADWAARQSAERSN